jgi:hypothetical protein
MPNGCIQETTLNDGKKSDICSSDCFFTLDTIGTHHFWPHFTHVAEVFYYYFSYLIWQQNVYSIDNRSACALTMIIPDKSPIWSLDPNSPKDPNAKWLISLFSSLEKFLGWQILQPQSCSPSVTYNPKYKWHYPHYPIHWFLHPSDAYILGSLILNTHPCVDEDKHVALKWANLKIIVIDRPLRGLKNANEVLKSLSQFLINDKPIRIESYSNDNNPELLNGSTARSLYLENKTFHEQVQLMRSSDIVITAHGAALTNIAFMKPCSIVIEVFPFGYYFPNYFGYLARRSGLLHYEWPASKEETEFHDDKQCLNILHDVSVSAKQSVSNDTSSYSYLVRVGDLCRQMHLCQMCYRKIHRFAKHVKINTKLLGDKMSSALLDRQRCIDKNPLYHINQPHTSYPYTQGHDLQDGMIVASDRNYTVYLLQHWKRYPFMNRKTVEALGYNLSQLIHIDDFTIQKIPVGDFILDNTTRIGHNEWSNNSSMILNPMKNIHDAGNSDSTWMMTVLLTMFLIIVVTCKLRRHQKHNR